MGRRSTLWWTVLGALALIAPVAGSQAPQLVWNPSASAQKGLYRLQAGGSPAVGSSTAPPKPLGS